MILSFFKKSDDTQKQDIIYDLEDCHCDESVKLANTNFLVAIKQKNTASMCAFKAMGANCFNVECVVKEACATGDENVVKALFEFGCQRIDVVKEYIDKNIMNKSEHQLVKFYDDYISKYEAQTKQVGVK